MNARSTATAAALYGLVVDTVASVSSPRVAEMVKLLKNTFLFVIEVDDGGYRVATSAEVDAALRQRELFGAAEYPVQRVGPDDRTGDVD